VARLVAVAYPENTASRRVLTKAGFLQTGTSDLYYGVHTLTFERLAPGAGTHRAGPNDP
jgi:RimJ/RimL family protein N-acetyltransferase